jgi:hypothetical protein
MVRPGFHAACDRWVVSEVLLRGTQATVLDRGSPLDDEGYRGGPTLGRLLEGVSHQRARCLRGVPMIGDNPDRWAWGATQDRQVDIAAPNPISKPMCAAETLIFEHRICLCEMTFLLIRTGYQ